MPGGSRPSFQPAGTLCIVLNGPAQLKHAPLFTLSLTNHYVKEAVNGMKDVCFLDEWLNIG